MPIFVKASHRARAHVREGKSVAGYTRSDRAKRASERLKNAIKRGDTSAARSASQTLATIRKQVRKGRKANRLRAATKFTRTQY